MPDPTQHVELPEEARTLALDAVSGPEYGGVPRPDSLLYEQIEKALIAALPAIYADLREKEGAKIKRLERELEMARGQEGLDPFVGEDGEQYMPATWRERSFLAHSLEAKERAEKAEQALAGLRERVEAAQKDRDGVPLLDAARALCPDGAHWENGWERYLDDASVCVLAFLEAALNTATKGGGEQ